MSEPPRWPARAVVLPVRYRRPAHLPFLNDLLKTEPLTALDLLVVFALSTLGYAAIRLDRVVHRDDRWRPGRG